MKQGSTTMTVEVDSELHQWFKMHAAATSKKLREVVSLAMEQYRTRIERRKNDGGK